MEPYDPTVVTFLERLSELNLKPTYTLSPQEARKVLDRIQEETIGPKLEKLFESRAKLVNETIMKNIWEDHTFRVIFVRALNKTGKLPVLLYLHGGGWILGSYKTHRNLIVRLALENQVCVVFVEYTRSPEVAFPVALEQAEKVLKSLPSWEDLYQIDLKRVFIAGDSVGGNMTAVLTNRFPSQFQGQILLYPLTNCDFYNASYTQFANGPWLTRNSVMATWDAYEPIPSRRVSSYHSPLLEDPKVLAAVPSTLIVTDENDVLRDEGEAYAHKLMASKVKVRAVRAIGMIHDFMLFNALQESPQVTNIYQTISAFLKDLTKDSY